MKLREHTGILRHVHRRILCKPTAGIDIGKNERADLVAIGTGNHDVTGIRLQMG
jgi:hypothetical protein